MPKKTIEVESGKVTEITFKADGYVWRATGTIEATGVAKQLQEQLEKVKQEEKDLDKEVEEKKKAIKERKAKLEELLKGK